MSLDPPDTDHTPAAGGTAPAWLAAWAVADPHAIGQSLADYWEGVGIPVERLTPDKAQPEKAAPTRAGANGNAPADRTKVAASVGLPATETPLAMAQRLANSAQDLPALKATLAAYTGLAVHRTARQMVFADGHSDAEIMVIGEAPGADEDEIGKPFVGASGQLLDKMFAAIGLSRTTNLYITNIVNWRPPGNRSPDEGELMLSRPFIDRHILLKSPKLVLLVGAVSAQALLGTTTGITKLAGQPQTLKTGLGDLPCFALLHPAYLLRRPQEKAAAWTHLKRLAGVIDQMGLPRGPSL
jgi:DNA polymerase